MLDKLEYLIALSRERHFAGRRTHAASHSPPCRRASSSSKSSSASCLVQRGSRFIGFTPEGERTLDWARRIVSDSRAMRQEITRTEKRGLTAD